MSAIFISHSSKDNRFCEKLMAWLSELGHRSLFLDFDESSGISAGQDWEQKLYKELRSCRAVIVVCSENLMESKWCFAEITHARSLGKPIFPIKIAPCNINFILSQTQVVDFMKMDEKEAFERLKKGLIKAGIDVKDLYDWDGSRPPYPGLLAFQEADAAIFFGREKEIGTGLDTLTSTYRYGGSGLVITLGASGSGKSSLVRAGILPRLKRDPERWLVLDPMLPRDDPFRELAKVLMSGFGNNTNEKRTVNELYDLLIQEAPHNTLATNSREGNGELPSEGMIISPSVEASMSHGSGIDLIKDFYEAVNRKNASILLVIDQLEELLDHPADHMGSQFLAFLRFKIEKKSTRLIVLGTMRSDFLGSFQQNAAMSGLEFGKILVGPVDTPSLSEIIEKPAEIAGVKIEPKLLHALIEDTSTYDVLPLLAFTLRELYDNYSDDNILEYREYKDLGRIQGAVAKAAEDILSHLKISTQQEELLRKAFLRMTRVNEQGNFTRKRVYWNDMPSEIHDVLKRLVNGRLLVSRGGEDQEANLEVAHEALFRSWDRLKNWLAEEREFLLWRRRLVNALEEWEHSERDQSTLLNGTMLYEASNWFERYEDQLEKKESAFIQESLKLAARRKRNRHRRNIGFMAITGIIILVILGFYKNAKNERNLAQASYLSSESKREVKLRPVVALQLAWAALQKKPHDSIFFADVVGIYVNNSLFNTIVKSKMLINTSVLSPDGKIILTGSEDNTARLWDLQGNQIGKSMKHDKGVTCVAFSPNNNILLTGSEDGNAHLWDLDGNAVGKNMKHDKSVTCVAFSPNNNMLLTGSADGNVHLWDMHGNAIGNTMKHEGGVTSVIFSRNGDTILTSAGNHKIPRGDGSYIGNESGVARLWDVRGNQIGQSMEHTAEVTCLAFSPDYKKILTGSMDSTSQLWDLEGHPIGKTMQHKGGVTSIAFSPDGTKVLTGSLDKTARLWDLEGNPKKGSMNHNSWVTCVAFSPNGDRILTGSYESVTIWDRDGETKIDQLENQGEIKSIAFSSDGGKVLTNSGSVHLKSGGRPDFGDYMVRLWYLESFQLGKLMVHSGDVNSVAFSPDGNMIFTGSSDKTARLWNLRGKPVSKPMVHAAAVTSVVFSPKGNSVLTCSSDTVRIWDLNGNLISKPMTPIENVTSMVFTPDNEHIVSSFNNSASLWDLEGNLLGNPMKQAKNVISIVISPKGKYVLTVSENNTVCLWDIYGKQVGKSIDHSEMVTSVVFSPEETNILTFALDSARIWDLHGNKISKSMSMNEFPFASGNFSSDGKKVLIYSSEKAQLWDLQGIKNGNPMVFSDIIRGVKFSPKGNKILIWFQNNNAVLVNLESKRTLKPIAVEDVYSAAFSTDGNRIFTRSLYAVGVWDMEGNNILKSFYLPEMPGDPTFSQNGKNLLWSDNKIAYLWEIVDLEDFLKINQLDQLSQMQKKYYKIEN